MSIHKKLNYILTRSQKAQILVLTVLLFVGILFEMAGLGILIPVFTLMLDSNLEKTHPALKPYLEFMGTPSQLQIVIIVMSILIFVYLLKGIFMIFLGWRQNKFTLKLSHNISCNLFVGYLRMPYMFHLHTNSALLLRNIQIEVGNFNSAAQSLITLSIELSMVIGAAIMLFVMEPLGSVVVTTFITASAFLFHRLTKERLLDWGEKRQNHQAQYNKHLFQGLGGVKEVKLMGREGSFLEEFRLDSLEISRIQLKIATISTVPRFYLELLAVIGLALLSILMVAQNKEMSLVLPTLGVFVAAAFRMIPSVNRIMISTQQIRVNQASVNVIYDELCLIRRSEVSIQRSGSIEFLNAFSLKNIVFSYPAADGNAIDGVSVIIKRGESIGFIGPSGSGKSTLVDLLLGLLTPKKGQILMDGKDISANIRGWQDKIGYVPQAIYLIDDSLRKNVAFGIPDSLIDEVAVISAIKDAQLSEFVASLPEGLETFVGERGVRLSGGQRQRIGIARALYHDPEVLVLDEATSALDTNIESEVMDCVISLGETKTLLIVAHRLSTVQNCDIIYRFEKGKIQDFGGPEKMLKIQKAVKKGSINQ